MTAKAGLRIGAAVTVIAAIVLVAGMPVGNWLEALGAWTVERPMQGAALYILVATISGILMTPGWIPMMLAGVLFGLGKGIALAAFGIVGGATAAFLAGRGLLRGPVERHIAGSRKLLAIDRAVVEQGFMIVVLTRLALVLPYNLLNYVYGVTRVQLPTYVVATALGMLPAISLYVYLGTLADDIGQMLEGGGNPPGGSAWISAAALAAIITVTIVIQRTARRVLDEQVITDESQSPEE